MNGLGTYNFGKGKWEGDKYEGMWKDDKRNGQGTYTFYDGSQNIGEHKDNKFWNGFTYGKNGNIIGQNVNGERIKQKPFPTPQII